MELVICIFCLFLWYERYRFDYIPCIALTWWHVPPPKLFKKDRWWQLIFWGGISPRMFGEMIQIWSIFSKIGWFNHLEKLPLREVVGLADLLETAKLQRCLENAKAWCQNAKVKNLSEAGWPYNRVAGLVEVGKLSGFLKVFFSQLKKQERNRALEIVEFLKGTMWEISVLRDSCERKEVELVRMTTKNTSPTAHQLTRD